MLPHYDVSRAPPAPPALPFGRNLCVPLVALLRISAVPLALITRQLQILQILNQ